MSECFGVGLLGRLATPRCANIRFDPPTPGFMKKWLPHTLARIHKPGGDLCEAQACTVCKISLDVVGGERMFQVSVEPRLEEICRNLRVVVLWSIAGPLKLCSRQVLGLGSSIGALRCTRSLAPMSVGQNAPVRSTLRGQCIKHASLLGPWYARHSEPGGHCTGRKHQGRPGYAFEEGNVI